LEKLREAELPAYMEKLAPIPGCVHLVLQLEGEETFFGSIQRKSSPQVLFRYWIAGVLSVYAEDISVYIAVGAEAEEIVRELASEFEKSE